MTVVPMVLSIIECVVLLAAFASGVAVATLVGMSKDDFQDDCILNSEIEWTSPTYFQVRPGGFAKCSYCIGLQAIAVIFAFLYAGYRAIVLVTNRFDVPLMRIIAAPVYATFAFLVLIQACILTMGLFNFCWGLQSEPTYANTDCGLFQDVAWQHYNGERFYDVLKNAEVASWVSFLSWCGLVLLNVANAVYQHKYAKMEGSS